MKSKFLHEDEISQLTDEEIRKKTIKEIDNGEYATHICRQCGLVRTDPESSTADAKILKQCRHCMKEKE